ncbi:MAG: adenylate/guanylate cyclase domain-containing protein [Planctomycetales bacterium]|nr:adenylate/guanylate cyclase domain-containing protein [Planctomycetales bacterium]
MGDTTATARRRLAAVMFLDMVGYSALMSRSEEKALAGVRDLEEIARGEVASAGGRLVKFLGDGSMAEFPTAAAACDCATKLLARVKARNEGKSGDDRFEIRIGLHLGELVEEKGDIYGDAVNIAARVQPLAEPGGIAMTGTVHAQVKNLLALRGYHLPPTKLKNIPDPVPIFVVLPEGQEAPRWRRTEFRRWRLPAAAAAVVALAGTGGWLLHHARGGGHGHAGGPHVPGGDQPVRVGLLYVRTQGDPEALALAREVEEELSALSPEFSKRVAWIPRAAVLDEYRKLGFDPTSALENLSEMSPEIRKRLDDKALTEIERRAFSVAREAGMYFSLLSRLVREASGAWKLESSIL